MTHEIAIYQDIDSATGYGPETLRRELARAAGQPVTVRLNSQGGNVIDGLAMYNLLKQYPGKVTVAIDGMALSIASIVAMAGEKIIMPENSWLMIHNPVNDVTGDGDGLRQMAGLLDGMRDQLAAVYAARSKRPIAEILDMMAAETWMTGRQAVEAGFATSTTAPLALAAVYDVTRFRNAPRQDKQPALTFETAVAFKVATGMPKSKAVRAVIIESPELHRAYLASVNGRTYTPPAAKATKRTGQTARDEWRAAIAAKMKAGLPKDRAIRQVCIEDPELQRAFVDESNNR